MADKDGFRGLETSHDMRFPFRNQQYARRDICSSTGQKFATKKKLQSETRRGSVDPCGCKPKSDLERYLSKIHSYVGHSTKKMTTTSKLQLTRNLLLGWKEIEIRFWAVRIDETFIKLHNYMELTLKMTLTNSINTSTDLMRFTYNFLLWYEFPSSKGICFRRGCSTSSY